MSSGIQIGPNGPALSSGPGFGSFTCDGGIAEDFHGLTPFLWQTKNPTATMVETNVSTLITILAMAP